MNDTIVFAFLNISMAPVQLINAVKIMFLPITLNNEITMQFLTESDDTSYRKR